MKILGELEDKAGGDYYEEYDFKVHDKNYTPNSTVLNTLNDEEGFHKRHSHIGSNNMASDASMFNNSKNTSQVAMKGK